MDALDACLGTLTAALILAELGDPHTFSGSQEWISWLEPSPPQPVPDAMRDQDPCHTKGEVPCACTCYGLSAPGPVQPYFYEGYNYTCTAPKNRSPKCRLWAC